MEELLKFVDQFSLEAQQYWRIPQLYTALEYEVQWQRAETPNWQIRQVGALFWKKVTTQDLVEAMNADRLDLVLFDQNLRSNIAQQVLFAETVLKRGSELLGKGAIDSAREDTKTFMAALLDAISMLKLGDPTESLMLPVPEPKAKLQVVREQG